MWYYRKADSEKRLAKLNKISDRTLKIKQRIDKETCNSLRNLLNSKVLKQKRTTRLFQKEKAGVNFELKRSEIGFKICEANPKIQYFREFDPGSGRTLAACLTHASRTERKKLASGA